MINRRRFVQAVTAAAAVPRLGRAAEAEPKFGKLLPDQKRVLDLPKGFDYQIIALAGQPMSDGLRAPGHADGMAAFASSDGNVRLVCNHESGPQEQPSSPFAGLSVSESSVDPSKVYDLGGGRTPGAGGTSTIVYDPRTKKTVRHFMSLAGTEYNCAGGPTPWGSWLSCEEAFSDPGPAWISGKAIIRDKKHGYVFEVPSSSDELVDPVPLTGMGRFEHEAAAVDPVSGVVYLTEDRHRSLFYRYVPEVAGQLSKGGRLQALARASADGFDTRNWVDPDALKPNAWFDVRWVDLEDVDNDRNDLRFRGYADGAAQFARGEGLSFADGSAFFACTIGGHDRLGQIFEYRVSPFEGTEQEQEQRGQLRLVAESTKNSLLRNADNVVMSPWGDLIACEDTADHCGLVGVRPNGSLYSIADNPYTSSELAGICFAPDGKTMFVNIQYNGMTLAITGPW